MATSNASGPVKETSFAESLRQTNADKPGPEGLPVYFPSIPSAEQAAAGDGGVIARGDVLLTMTLSTDQLPAGTPVVGRSRACPVAAARASLYHLLLHLASVAGAPVFIETMINDALQDEPGDAEAPCGDVVVDMAVGARLWIMLTDDQLATFTAALSDHVAADPVTNVAMWKVPPARRKSEPGGATWLRPGPGDATYLQPCTQAVLAHLVAQSLGGTWPGHEGGMSFSHVPAVADTGADTDLGTFGPLFGDEAADDTTTGGVNSKYVFAWALVENQFDTDFFGAQLDTAPTWQKTMDNYFERGDDGEARLRFPRMDLVIHVKTGAGTQFTSGADFTNRLLIGRPRWSMIKQCLIDNWRNGPGKDIRAEVEATSEASLVARMQDPTNCLTDPALLVPIRRPEPIRSTPTPCDEAILAAFPLACRINAMTHRLRSLCPTTAVYRDHCVKAWREMMSAAPGVPPIMAEAARFAGDHQTVMDSGTGNAAALKTFGFSARRWRAASAKRGFELRYDSYLALTTLQDVGRVGKVLKIQRVAAYSTWWLLIRSRRLAAEDAVFVMLMGRRGAGKSDTLKLLRKMTCIGVENIDSATLAGLQTHLCGAFLFIDDMKDNLSPEQRAWLRTIMSNGAGGTRKKYSLGDNRWESRNEAILQLVALVTATNRAVVGDRAFMDRCMLLNIRENKTSIDTEGDTVRKMIMTPVNPEVSQLAQLHFQLRMAWATMGYALEAAGAFAIDNTMVYVVVGLMERHFGDDMVRDRLLRQIMIAAQSWMMGRITTLFMTRIRPGLDPDKADAEFVEWMWQKSWISGEDALRAVWNVCTTVDDTAAKRDIEKAVKAHVMWDPHTGAPVRHGDEPYYVLKLVGPIEQVVPLVSQTTESAIGDGVIEGMLTKLQNTMAPDGLPMVAIDLNHQKVSARPWLLHESCASGVVDRNESAIRAALRAYAQCAGLEDADPEAFALPRGIDPPAGAMVSVVVDPDCPGGDDERPAKRRRATDTGPAVAVRSDVVGTLATPTAISSMCSTIDTTHPTTGDIVMRRPAAVASMTPQAIQLGMYWLKQRPGVEQPEGSVTVGQVAADGVVGAVVADSSPLRDFKMCRGGGDYRVTPIGRTGALVVPWRLLAGETVRDPVIPAAMAALFDDVLSLVGYTEGEAFCPGGSVNSPDHETVVIHTYTPPAEPVHIVNPLVVKKACTARFANSPEPEPAPATDYDFDAELTNSAFAPQDESAPTSGALGGYVDQKLFTSGEAMDIPAGSVNLHETIEEDHTKRNAGHNPRPEYSDATLNFV